MKALKASWRPGPCALLAVAALAVPALTASARPEPTAEEAPRSVQQVKDFLAGYLAALESRDEDALPDMFVADGRFRWFTDGALSYASATDVLDGMRQYGGARFATVLTDVRVVLLGERHASASATFRTDLTIPGADDHSYGGVITWVLEREAERERWRIVTGHTSTPGGPPREGQSTYGEHGHEGR